MSRGVFVCHSEDLAEERGGVQVCTQEYIGVLRTAGIELRFCTLEVDRRLSTRFFRRCMSTSYIRPAEPNAVEVICRHLNKEPPDFIFLNQLEWMALAEEMRCHLPAHSKIVVLSHGFESTDLLHILRLRDRLPLSARTRPTAALALGYALLKEQSFAARIDLMCGLSPFDVELGHWLGVTKAGWLPRVIESAPIDWRPTGRRLGYFGTLDHAPNLEGLVETISRLSMQDCGPIRIRVVGRPIKTGVWLARKYPLVEYLGPIADQALAEEAATWNAVLHPIFCYPRGCSTKLATAIAWHLPVVTTTMGHRGYEWRKGELVVADDPATYAQECLRLLSYDEAVEARDHVIRVACTSPTIAEIAVRMRALLDL